MVIRRIREHVTAHNWFAVTIDFLIVVAGIVIGTQVNNWNQARIERNQGDDYRARLIEDLRANDRELLMRRAYYRSIQNHAEEALAALDRPAGSEDATFLVDAYMASHSIRRHSKRFTYDELLSTGRFGQIGDRALREQVTEYYVELDANAVLFSFVPPYRDQIRSVMPSAVQRAIRDQCGRLLTGLLRDCDLRVPPGDVATAIAKVRSAPQIRAGLTRVIADVDVKLELLNLLLARERQLRASVERRS